MSTAAHWDEAAGLDGARQVDDEAALRAAFGYVTVFFFEVLPRLRPGVLVHIHDILLPSDYPPQWRWRAYSEQYLLAAFLLADRGRYVVELPNAYIADDPALGGLFDDLWAGLGLRDRLRPSSFWLSVQP